MCPIFMESFHAYLSSYPWAPRSNYESCFHQYFSVENENKFLVGPKTIFFSQLNKWKQISRNIGKETWWKYDL